MSKHYILKDYMWKKKAHREWNKLKKPKLLCGKWHGEAEFKRLFWALHYFQYESKLMYFSWRTSEYCINDFITILIEYLSDSFLFLQCDENTLYITKEQERPLSFYDDIYDAY